MTVGRRWLVRIVLLLVAGTAGYASRGAWQHQLPLPIRKRTGDALWAAAVFSLLGVVRPRWSTVRTAGVALAVCYAIEFGQLYQAPWIERLRATSAGRLVLGSTFFWLDQVAYTVGIACWASAEAVGNGLLRGRPAGDDGG